MLTHFSARGLVPHIDVAPKAHDAAGFFDNVVLAFDGLTLQPSRSVGVGDQRRWHLHGMVAGFACSLLGSFDGQ